MANCNTIGVLKMTQTERKKKKPAIKRLPRNNKPKVKNKIKQKKINNKIPIS